MQQFPAFWAPGTTFVEDSFYMDNGGWEGNGLGMIIVKHNLVP